MFQFKVIKEKFIEILEKTKYFIEFLLSLCLIIGIYKTILIHAYQGTWNIYLLICDVILAGLEVLIIIYNLKKSNKIIEKIFLTFVIPIGISYMIFILPTNVPDEEAHIWKAYEVSTGKIITEIDENGESYIQIPQDLIKYNIDKTKKYNQINYQINSDNNYENVMEINSPAQGYPFILYISSALGFLIVRLLNFNIIYGIYLGRLFNLLVFIIGGYFAIKKIPFAKIPLMIFLLTPMILQQAASFSADALTNTVIIFYIAYLTNLIFKQEKINKQEKIFVVLLSCIVAIAKIAYIPIIGLNILLFFKKDMAKKEKIILISISIVVAIISAIAVYSFSNMYTSNITSEYLTQTGVNPLEQIKYIISHPIAYIKVLVNNVLWNANNYIDGMIGTPMGWLNIPINAITISAIKIILIIALVSEKNEEAYTKKQKIWLFIIMVITIILIKTVFYISWSGVGAEEILGIQGRYFIPIAALGIVTLAMKNNYLKFKNIEYILPTVMTVVTLLVTNDIYRFFIQ